MSKYKVGAHINLREEDNFSYMTVLGRLTVKILALYGLITLVDFALRVNGL